jgi:hypothetical protein
LEVQFLYVLSCYCIFHRFCFLSVCRHNVIFTITYKVIFNWYFWSSKIYFLSQKTGPKWKSYYPETNSGRIHRRIDDIHYYSLLSTPHQGQLGESNPTCFQTRGPLDAKDGWLAAVISNNHKAIEFVKLLVKLFSYDMYMSAGWNIIL